MDNKSYFPFEEIYHAFLIEKEKENYSKRYEGKEDKRGMSRAGQCYLKHWYYSKKYERFYLEPRKMRAPRFGKLMHDDLEIALKLWYEDPKHDRYKGIPIAKQFLASEMYVEQILHDEDRRGHSDMYFIVVNDGIADVYDLKTMHSWGWRIKFGKTNIEDNNIFNQMQLMTYAKAIMKKHKIEVVRTSVLYYKKDDSEMKIVEYAPTDYFDLCDKYWDDLDVFMKSMENDRFASQVVPTIHKNTPVEKWECDYCSYEPHCQEILDNQGSLV